MVQLLEERSSGLARGAKIHIRTSDPAMAEQVIDDAYGPHHLKVVGSPQRVDMEFTGIRLGAVTAGRLSYGTAVRIEVEETHNVHVNLSLRGRATARLEGQEVITGRGEGAVIAEGRRVDLAWPGDIVQLCLMVPTNAVTSELENLLGRSVRHPVRFEVALDLGNELGRRWRPALQLIANELSSPSGMSHLSSAARHVEGLVLDGLLMGQPHSYTDQLMQCTLGSRTGAQRAADLLRDRPEEPWTTTRLAREVHVSVRALQDGFQRHYGTSPTRYLRAVRLARVREHLELAVPGTTTVQAVATTFGFLHMGRFTAAFRATYGELPSETLRRPPS